MLQMMTRPSNSRNKAFKKIGSFFVFFVRETCSRGPLSVYVGFDKLCNIMARFVSDSTRIFFREGAANGVGGGACCLGVGRGFL